MLVLINYFYKYINMTKKKYEGAFFIPSIDTISKELKKATFPTFFLNTDFNNFIEQLEEKLLRLNQFSYKRIVWNVINIITRLKEYQKFCTQTRYSFISVIKGEQEQYNIYDTKNFFLKSMDNFSFDHKTVLFLENSEIINGKNGMFVMDKRVFKEDTSNYKEEILPMDNRVQRVIAGRIAEISAEAIPIIASLVSNILIAVKEYLDYCGLSIVFEIETLLTIK